MIQISRCLVRHARAIFTRLAERTPTSPPVVSFQTGSDGLRVRLHQTGIQAELLTPGVLPAETLVLPLDALAAFAGRDGGVSLEAGASAAAVRARWSDDPLPQVQEFAVPAAPAPFPAPARMLVGGNQHLRQALAAAAGCAARAAGSYATDQIQLRGRAGEIVATDSRQLLVQTGFRFPFTEDLVIPAATVFGDRELGPQEPTLIGKEGAQLTLRSGRWTFFLPIDVRGRFPPIETVIPALASAVSRFCVDREDGRFLMRALARRPGGADQVAAVTVALNGQVTVRARGADQGRATEIVLSRSAATGRPVCFSTDPEFLQRALGLGFSAFHVVDAEAPIMALDERRKYVWMPLGKIGLVAAADDVLQMETAAAKPSSPAPTPRRRKRTMNEVAPADAVDPSSVSEKVNDSSPRKVAGGGLDALVDEVADLQATLASAYARSRRLAGLLKEHRRRHQAVCATLASLRQLPLEP